MDATALGGRGYARFLAAGAYFLKKYRGILNDLNVYPVPDGDTGTNMYLTLRSAARSAYAAGDAPFSDVAAEAAQGALMGARGNSGVILSQMVRGFAHHVRHRDEIDGFVAATGLREAALAARQALLKPVEGTIVSVAEAAAEAAYRIALHEPDLVRFLAAVVRAANEALERTPEQLPSLAEAGVVDAGGAGFVYLLEGILAFLPDVRVRTTAFPRRPIRAQVFKPTQAVGAMRYCTELILEHATCNAGELRRTLEPLGESLLVVGEKPMLKVHVHTDEPERIKAIAARYGVPTRLKVDDMAHQHHMLLIEPPQRERSVVAVVPGSGFARIVRELGAETVVTAERPSTGDLLLAINKSMSDCVYLLTNDVDLVPAAKEAASRASREVHVVETSDVVQGIAVLLMMRNEPSPSRERMREAASRSHGARLLLADGAPEAFFDGRSFKGETIAQAARAVVAEMRNGSRGLVTLYYGGGQREKDAQHISEELRATDTGLEVEYYYGGMKNAEYWIAFDE